MKMPVCTVPLVNTGVTCSHNDSQKYSKGVIVPQLHYRASPAIPSLKWRYRRYPYNQRQDCGAPRQDRACKFAPAFFFPKLHFAAFPAPVVVSPPQFDDHTRRNRVVRYIAGRQQMSRISHSKCCGHQGDIPSPPILQGTTSGEGHV
uniref:Uncharacterized protein n=1 Tax=Eutreptiella gymnastica TaxID=73025 RepID=A0A7S4GAN7_9EUGL